MIDLSSYSSIHIQIAFDLGGVYMEEGQLSCMVG